MSDATDIVVKLMDFFSHTLLAVVFEPAKEWLGKRGVKGMYLMILILFGITILMGVVGALAYLNTPR